MNGHQRSGHVGRSGGSGDLRQGNLAQILRYLRDHGSSSRHDVAVGCGLGVSTMTDLVGGLRERRLVRELDPIRGPGAGRPTRPITLDGDPWCVFGVHVEREQVYVVVTSVGGEELSREALRIEPSELAAGPEPLAGLLRGHLDVIPDDRHLVGVAIGLPGSVRPDGVVASSTTLDWSEVPLQAAVSETLAGAGLTDVWVGVSSDSQLSGLAAARSTLVNPTGTVAAYFGGTRDLGGAVLIDGEIFPGAVGGAGDLGHLNVAGDGPGCWCGRSGCLNAFLRLEGLLVRSDLMSSDEAVQASLSDPAEAANALAQAAEAGNDAVLKTLEQAGDALGLAVDNTIGTLNPDAVLLGGYLGPLGPSLRPAMDRRVQVRTGEGVYADTQVHLVPAGGHPVSEGAVLAARDACLANPLGLTFPL